ncbi:MAG TPA: serine hydrolase domain-containing protein [Candidatus Angelobacter sp.]|nr:serine hydrolase domain-containing protein [Candidatus Angelobacter sp.]
MKLRIALLAIQFAMLTSFATAQLPKATPIPPTPQAPTAGESRVTEPPHELTVADLHAFLDGFLPMQLEREDIAGAVVLVVKDGTILFAKGYGYSDVEKKTPVTVDATLFRPGSVSKLFTWTAVMQLVEQGKLDLDRDINEYLDFKIPAKFGKPITLRNIMTHTPGFEEQIKDLISEEPTPMTTLKQHLVTHIPERIFPPGTIPAYSNYGAALAGYIVERVSGRPFTDYVNENIFKPLGMGHSTFAQPLPAELKPLMSNGYRLGSGKPKPFEIIEEAPAGALAATASDLGRFMIAHLQNGKFENGQILRPETAALMHSRQFGLSPALNGMCLGFYEESRNGRRIIGHGGDTVYFHSDLHLIPENGIGFFVSYNSAGKGEISPRSALWYHFLDRYFPYTPAKVEKLASADADAKTVAGRYLTSRRSESNFLKVGAIEENVRVIPDENGTIKVEPFKDFNGQIKTWQEIAPLVYRSVNGQDLIAFRRLNNDGGLILAPNFPAAAEQRISLLNSADFNQSLILGIVVILGLTLLCWPLAAMIRGHYHQRLDLDPSYMRLRPWVRVVCAVDVAFLLIFLTVLTSAGPNDLSSRTDFKFHAMQSLGVVGALGTMVVLLACLRSWRDPQAWFWGKMWNLLLLVACLAFVWFSYHWNLLNFNMNY